jgi:cell division protein FtsB
VRKVGKTMRKFGEVRGMTGIEIFFLVTLEVISASAMFMFGYSMGLMRSASMQPSVLKLIGKAESELLELKAEIAAIKEAVNDLD